MDGMNQRSPSASTAEFFNTIDPNRSSGGFIHPSKAQV
jgi:hypothetical protein